MMREYKLIKEYPGSPKIGKIVCEQEETTYYVEAGEGDIRIFRKETVENHPAYWAEVHMIIDGTRLLEGEIYWWVSKIKDYSDPIQKRYVEKNDFRNDRENDYHKKFKTEKEAIKYREELVGKSVYGVYPMGLWVELDNIKSTETKCYGEKWKWFDTKEERENFIRENKPQFTKKDMLKFAKFYAANVILEGVGCSLSVKHCFGKYFIENKA
jgi:hypothetical protein